MAIYESGTPDVLTVLLSSKGFDDMVARAEYLKRVQGFQESVVGRVRQLRNEAKRTVIRLADARRRIEAARDAIAAQEQQLAAARASVESRQADLVAARAKRESALAEIRNSEQQLEGDVSAIQQKIRRRSPRPPRSRRCPRARSERPAPPASSGRWTVPSSPDSACAGAGCTRGSISPFRPGRRSGPPPRAP